MEAIRFHHLFAKLIILYFTANNFHIINSFEIEIFFIILNQTNFMKIIFGSFLLLSGIFSAQTALEPLKRDSLDLHKFDSSIITETEPASIDSTLVKLYKMPVAKPENPEIYSSLKATVKSNTQFKILNPLDSFKTKKLATK